MKPASRRLLTRLLFLGGGSLCGLSQAEEISFDRDIRPILAEACFPCHGPDAGARQAGLRLDTEEGATGHRDGDPAIVSGAPQQSLVVQRISAADPLDRMPPPDSNLRLSEPQIDLLTRWIAAGAPWAEHWAFVTPRRPALPAVGQREWTRNPIDVFVLARLERAGLHPSPAAQRTTLLRRVSLDLTGLPPSPDEVDAFLADPRPHAYERAVDRLLGSPRYGERMVWEWLDAARYADSNGYQGDQERTMWPWRDWAVDAMNAGTPFDRLTIAQLAGDLLESAAYEERLATGFNRNHMINGEGGRIAEENRVEYVFDQTETTATIWLGLTLGCARCHDHKFDPLTQREYYQLFAFFNNTPVTGRGGSGQTAPVIEHVTAESRARLRRLADQLEQAARVVAGLEVDVLARADRGRSATASLPAPVRKALEEEPSDRDRKTLALLSEHFEASEPEYASSLDALRRAREAHDRFRDEIPKVMVMEENDTPRETHVLVRGTYNMPGEEVTAALPRALPEIPAGTRMDRLALARWLMDPRHPLTARVTVNRHWQRFFGVGLVKTAGDFGTQGEKPSHPRLLDYLATELVASGWDVKRLQRLIVTSATYQQSSRVSEALAERDPENRLLARGARFRLPSFVIRDQALYTSGLLVEKLGGPAVHPYQPAGIWEEATFGKKSYPQDSGEKLYRRSLYTFWRRIVGPSTLFDTASRQTCVVDAQRTNTPLHALTTLNDVTYVEAARHLAQDVVREGPQRSTADRVRRAFFRVTARRPTAPETEVLMRRLEALEAHYAAAPEAAESLLGVGESARVEELDAARVAALTALATLLYNLDETLTRE